MADLLELEDLEVWKNESFFQYALRMVPRTNPHALFKSQSTLLHKLVLEVNLAGDYRVVYQGDIDIVYLGKDPKEAIYVFNQIASGIEPD